MDFAEWIISGLDQLRTGQLPNGQALYQTVSTGLGGHPALDAFLASGDSAARAQLVQLVAQATAANPGFEQRLRASAAVAQAGGPAQIPFRKTTNGIVVLAAAAVLVVAGGVGLAVGVSGGGGKSGGVAPGVGRGTTGGGSTLVSVLLGTWTCSGGGEGVGTGTITIGDGTWSAGGDAGTWTLTGGKATLTSRSNPGDDITATGVPSLPGAFDIAAGAAADGANQAPPTHLTGTVSGHQLKLTLAVPGSEMNPSISCTK
jgi:hypothetical protein